MGAARVPTLCDPPRIAFRPSPGPSPPDSDPASTSPDIRPGSAFLFGRGRGIRLLVFLANRPGLFPERIGFVLAIGGGEQFG